MNKKRLIRFIIATLLVAAGLVAACSTPTPVPDPVATPIPAPVAEETPVPATPITTTPVVPENDLIQSLFATLGQTPNWEPIEVGQEFTITNSKGKEYTISVSNEGVTIDSQIFEVTEIAVLPLMVENGNVITWSGIIFIYQEDNSIFIERSLESLTSEQATTVDRFYQNFLREQG